MMTKTLKTFMFFLNLSLIFLFFNFIASGSRGRDVVKLLVNGSSLYSRSEFSTIIRLLSNDLPPLHSQRQTYLNTELILKREKLPTGFKRLWILKSIVNRTKEAELVKLLRYFREDFEIIPLSNSNDPKILQKEVRDTNSGRNFGILRAFDDGASWVFVFDGCLFITTEGFSSFKTFLSKPNKTEFLKFVPMVRLEYKLDINMSIVYSELFPYISGLEENQIAVSRKFLDARNEILMFKDRVGFLFEENRQYGNKDKLQLLEDAKKKLTDEQVHCRKADCRWWKPKSRIFQEDEDLMNGCGYALRLLYNPESEAPVDQYVDYRKRGPRRNKSVKLFMTSLEQVAAENK